MKYRMREQFWSFGDTFDIKDESGEPVYRVEGDILSIGDSLTFEDTNGRKLAHIDEVMLSWGPTYQIYRDGEKVARVKKEVFSFFSCEFEVDVPGPDDYTAEGDFLDHEYTFERSGRTVAQVSKEWFAMTDTYGIEVNEEEDQVLILASAVVIDMVCHEEENQ